jgi:hypothetical protein
MPQGVEYPASRTTRFVLRPKAPRGGISKALHYNSGCQNGNRSALLVIQGFRIIVVTLSLQVIRRVAVLFANCERVKPMYFLLLFASTTIRVACRQSRMYVARVLDYDRANEDGLFPAACCTEHQKSLLIVDTILAWKTL